jgi:hypothetical protein
MTSPVYFSDPLIYSVVLRSYSNIHSEFIIMGRRNGGPLVSNAEKQGGAPTNIRSKGDTVRTVVTHLLAMQKVPGLMLRNKNCDETLNLFHYVRKEAKSKGPFLLVVRIKNRVVCKSEHS